MIHVPNRFNRLSLKLVTATAFFMLLLLVTVATAVDLGLRQLQIDTVQLSADALSTQGKAYLQELVNLQAARSDDTFSRAVDLTRTAAAFLAAAHARGLRAEDTLDLQLHPGQDLRFDANPNRITDLVLPVYTPIDAAQRGRLLESALLDTLFPALYDQFPGAVAMYYQEASMAFRYYPAMGIADNLSGTPGLDPVNRNYMTEQAPAAPVNNPDRATVWTSPYVDNAGQGLMVTVNTPVYFGTDYAGIMSMDISLAALVDRLATMEPTSHSFAFLVDGQNALVAASPAGIGALVGSEPAEETQLDAILGVSLVDNPYLAPVLPSMMSGQIGDADFTFGGRAFRLSYAPLPTLGWTLAVAAPVDELTAPVQVVAAQMAKNAVRILRTLIGLIALFFLVALAAVFLTNRVLIRPVTSLMQGAEAIAAGDLDVTLPQTSGDELGRLALSFNHMTGALRESRKSLEAQNSALRLEMSERTAAEQALRTVEERNRHILERRVEERTRELTTLLQLSHRLTATFDIDSLLDVVLDALVDIIEHSAVAIFLLDGDDLVLSKYRGPATPEQLVPTWPVAEARHTHAVIYQKRPLIIDDVRAENEDAARYRAFVDSRVGATPDYVGTWMAVPLATKDEVIGILSFDAAAPGAYSQREADLALAFANQAAVAIENARLHSRFEHAAVLEERQRLARELHDSVSQALYGIALGTRTARTLLDRDPARVAEPLDYVLSLAEAGLAEMRALIFELRPESLENEGLLVALEKQIAAMRARHHLNAHVVFDCGEPALPIERKEALYRVVQEALNNVVKHAAATQVALQLGCDNRVVHLQIRDDGIGFDPGRSFPGHLGLHSMHERIAKLGGSLTIESTPGQGTVVDVHLPISTKAADAVSRREPGQVAREERSEP